MTILLPSMKMMMMPTAVKLNMVMNGAVATAMNMVMTGAVVTVMNIVNTGAVVTVANMVTTGLVETVVNMTMLLRKRKRLVVPSLDLYPGKLDSVVSMNDSVDFVY